MQTTPKEIKQYNRKCPGEVFVINKYLLGDGGV